MAMFPPSIPHTFIDWLTEPGDVVYDPFSGRGTTALEACLMGRVGFGSDASPLAWLLSAAKVDPPRQARVLLRIEQLRAASITAGCTEHAPDHIRMLFSPKSLQQLLWLRRNIDLTKRADRFLMASLLGILHANANSDGTPRGLSISMPNTFSMAPGYVARYIKEHRLVAPEVDVFDALIQRIAALGDVSADFVRGRAWRANAFKPRPGPAPERAKLVFTSPPYLQAILYGKFNWIRLWMLGHEPKSVDAKLFTSSSLPKYLHFMSGVATQVRRSLRDDGYACFVIGDVRRDDKNLNLAQAVAASCFRGTDLRLVNVVDDKLPVQHKVSRIWKESKGRATKTDRIIVLAGPKAGPLRGLPAPIWN
jgi:site-specific DNA-methyltransferase (adenine-specific)